MNCDITKKHSKAVASVVQKCKICDQDFQSFFLFRDHKRKEHGAQRGSAAQSVGVAKIMGYFEKKSLTEELKTCKQFLVDIEMRNWETQSIQFCQGYSGPEISVGKVMSCV